MDLKEFALTLPYPIQQPIKYIYGAIPFSIRWGSIFRETHALLQESQWWSREKLEEYQMRQLEKLLAHAYENVPYYRRVFDERGLKPKDIQKLDDLRKLPYLTKDIIRENLKDLMARNYPKSKFRYATTGGSSAIPLGFYLERGVTEAKEWAFKLTQWKRVGIKSGDKNVVLRGNVVRSATKDRFWEYNPVNKSLEFSCYHLTDETLPKCVEKIREFKPDFIRTYPSLVTLLARFMKENKVASFPTLKALVCVSENLYPWQRELLEEIFQCRVFGTYGDSERAVMAGECEKSTCYHILPEYSIVELIGRDGNPVTEEGETGEVVTTGFNNFAFPFIRYKKEDLAVHTKAKCECGRNYALLKNIEGRLQELIIDSDGGLMSLGPAIFGIHDVEWAKVKQIQFLQETPGELIIQVVKDTPYSEAEMESYVLRLFRDTLKERFKLKVRFVDYIPRTQSGKYRFLIQKLPVKFGV